MKYGTAIRSTIKEYSEKLHVVSGMTSIASAGLRDDSLSLIATGIGMNPLCRLRHKTIYDGIVDRRYIMQELRNGDGIMSHHLCLS